MKTKFTLLLLLVVVNICAELPDQLCTKNLDAYVGTWQYTSNTITFKITFKKLPQNTTMLVGECLVGDYYLKKNGTILSSSEAIQISVFNGENAVIYATNGRILDLEEYTVTCDDVNPNHLWVSIDDKVYNKTMYNWEIDLLSPTKIKWWRDTIYYGMYGSEEDLIRYNQTSLPENITLTKVKEVEKELIKPTLKPLKPRN